MVLLRLFLEIVGDVANLEGGAKVLAEPADGLHLHEVDNALKLRLLADGQLKNGGFGAKQVDDGLDAEVEVGAGAVHLVEEAHARHLVLVRLPPNGLGLWLHASNAIKDGDCAVEDTERAFDLEGEVDVARRVDDVDAVLARVGDVAATLAEGRGAQAMGPGGVSIGCVSSSCQARECVSAAAQPLDPVLTPSTPYSPLTEGSQ
eukprot:scaffold209589_cov35-Tisochrysis_lutea.AAC.3